MPRFICRLDSNTPKAHRREVAWLAHPAPFRLSRPPPDTFPSQAVRIWRPRCMARLCAFWPAEGCRCQMPAGEEPPSASSPLLLPQLNGWTDSNLTRQGPDRTTGFAIGNRCSQATTPVRSPQILRSDDCGFTDEGMRTRGAGSLVDSRLREFTASRADPLDSIEHAVYLAMEPPSSRSARDDLLRARPEFLNRFRTGASPCEHVCG